MGTHRVLKRVLTGSALEGGAEGERHQGGTRGGTRWVLTGYSRVLTGGLLQVVLKGSGLKESDGSEREPMKYKRDCNCEAECCPQCRCGHYRPVPVELSVVRPFAPFSFPPPQWSLECP